MSRSSSIAAAAARIPPRTDPVRWSKLPWQHPTMLAPMEGVTHATLRELVAARGGVGVVCTEFLRVGRGALNRATLRQSVVKAEGVPLSVQVMGNEADKMAEAAALVAEAGADVVDVNLGCPMPRAVRKGVGAAMLRDPELLYDVLRAMRRATPGMLSAKIRAGFDAAGDAVAIARVVEAAGVDYVVVHARRRCDFYDGVADWRIVRRIKEALRIPVIGNGDVWYATDAVRLLAESGADGVMIGRPALRNPWLFEQIAHLRAGQEPRRPSGEELFAHIHQVATRYQGEMAAHRTGGLGKLKELIRYLGRSLDDGGAFRREALRQGSTDELLRFCEGALSRLPADDLDLDATGQLALEGTATALSVEPAAAA